jgi:hypothetical protein
VLVPDKVVVVSKKLSGEDSHRATVDPAALPLRVNGVLFVPLQTVAAPLTLPVAGTFTVMFLVPSTVPCGLSPGMSPYSMMLAK